MEGKESVGIVDEAPESKKVLIVVIVDDRPPRVLSLGERIRALLALSALAGLPISEGLINAEKVISRGGTLGCCACGKRISYNKDQCLACKEKEV